MSSDDTTTTAEDADEVAAHDEVRESQLETLRSELGSALVGSHIRAGDDLWVRVDRTSWRVAAEVAKARLECDFFDFLSAIDWLPSPFGRGMDSQEDVVVHGLEPKDPGPMRSGYTGGDTRFQLLARLYSTTRHMGITFKADLPDDDMSVETWVPVYAGANWHERETAEMFGIDFVGHPELKHIYLPSGFEGHPLRKDFPLLARRVKPWPGIVDVEPMPGIEGEDEGEAGQ